MSGGLGPIRRKIEEIDQKIVKLMIERNDAAEMVGEIKKEFGIPLRHLETEESIVRKYRRAAENTTLSPDVAETVCRMLISGSVELQALILREGHSDKISIIGGGGRMGGWMAKYFESMGSTVNIVDTDIGNMNDIKDSDIVVISVPISSVSNVLKEADRLCRDDALIFDISSIKSPFSDQLKEMAKRRKVCSVHPMFGPSALSMTDKNVLICDCGCEAAVEEAKRLFKSDVPNMVVTSVEDHDRFMSYSLGLAHASNIIFLTALKGSGIPFSEVKKVSSATLDRTLKASVPVTSENASLYHEVQRLNINTEDMWDVFEKAFTDVKDSSLSADGEKFAAILEEGKNYLGT